MKTPTNFGGLDWGIVALFLIGITLAGLWTKRFLDHHEGYFIAGRKVRGYLGVASIIASEMGLVTVMYSSQKGFTGGFAAFHIALVAAVVALVVGVTGFIVVPLRKTGVMTIPEYYEQRYGKGARVVGGAILSLSGILNMGMFLKADSLFVTSVMGLQSDLALKIAMTLLLVLVLLYTALGGMISVLVTDFLQFVIMAVALVAISVILMGQLSWGQLVQGVQTIKGEAGFNPFSQQGFGAPYVIWMTFMGLIACSVWQTSVVRASSAEDIAAVKKTFTWGSIGFLIRFMIPYFWGIVALVYLFGKPEYAAFLDPKAKSELTLRAMPVALAQLLPTGILGVLTAGMLAAAMSTYNTYLHSWSMVLARDVLGPLYGDRLTERKKISMTQVFMVLVGIFLLVWGLWYPLGEDLWDYMAVTGAIYFTGAFAALVGGLYWKKASLAGAYGAFACGGFAFLGLKPVQKLLGVDWPSEIVGLSGVALGWIVMVGLSLLFPNRKERV